MQIIHSDVRHFKPKQDNLLEYLNKEELPRKFLCSIFYVAILFSLLASFYINELNISLYLYISAILACFVSLTLYLSEEKKDEKEAIIANEENKDYLLCLGTEIKKFYGNARNKKLLI